MIHDFSGVGPSVPPLLGINLAEVAWRDHISMGMGTVNAQMAVRAQRALMRRLTRRWEGQQTSRAGGQPASSALSASFKCLCASSFTQCTPFPAYGKAVARVRTCTSNDKEDDLQPSLEGDDNEGYDKRFYFFSKMC